MLWEMMNDENRCQKIVERSVEKNINPKWISVFYNSQIRNLVYGRIREGTYKIFPPHIGLIPKENGEMRQVYINEPIDRIMLMIINDCLFDAFPEMIHPNCVSYQKGIGTQMVIKKISRRLSKIEEIAIRDGDVKERIGVKMDFSKYFDNVSIECIDGIFEKMKSKLPKDEHCIIDYLSKYYHQDWYFDENNELRKKYQGLKQGCAVASFLACAIPYDYDVYMSNKYKVYYRYSDDVIVLDSENSKVESETRKIMGRYGVSLNPKKVESIYYDKWIKFLGFELKGSKITLSPARFRNFESTILELTRDRKRKSAFKSVIRWMYLGEHSWASTCLSTINCESDINEMEKFVKDAINSSEFKYRKLGRLHTNLTKKDGILFRDKGEKIHKYRKHWLEGYYTMQCMRNSLTYNKQLFECLGREMMRLESL